MTTEEAMHSEAKQMIDEIIHNALVRLATTMSDSEGTNESIKFGDTSRMSPAIEVKREEFQIGDIEWLAIEEFSVPAAENKIETFIKTWEFENCWLYCINFLGEDDHEFDKRYRFRVRWSIPTRRKPIPRATASVYFTFSVSKIKPHNFPVEVYYVFETNRLVHRPGQSRFREKWLKDIIESKVLMMSMIPF